MFTPFQVLLPSIPETRFDIRDYGAVGDGRTPNTAAFRRAIEAASVRNVLVENCVFIDSDVGICFKSAMGRGGTVERIHLKDIEMIRKDRETLSMSMDYVHNLMDYYDPVVQSSDPEDIPAFRDVKLQRCICPDPDAYFRIAPLAGYPDSIRDIRLTDCVLGRRTE